MRPYSPGGILNALAAAQEGSIPLTPSIHRLGRGLPGYLILFATHAFAPQRQIRPSELPSPSVFLPISTHFTATPGIPLTSAFLQSASMKSSFRVEPWRFHFTLNRAAYAPFTPSKSGQRLLPTSYRGCWHVVSRSLFSGYRPKSFPEKGVYRPRSVILHAASLHQGFPHCARFPTAATRRCVGRVSVPLGRIILSDPLPVVGLVGRYPTNYLIGHEPLLKRKTI